MKRTRLSPVSPKRRLQLREYTRLRAIFLTQRPTCERCQKRRATDVHHKAGRYGGNYLKVETWAALCRPCHQHVEEHKSESRAQGWITY